MGYSDTEINLNLISGVLFMAKWNNFYLNKAQCGVIVSVFTMKE